MIKRKNPTDYDYFERMQLFETPVAKIIDIGIEIPDRVVSNEEIAEIIDAPAKLKKALPGIIERSTGNKNRVYAPQGTLPSDLAIAAIDDLTQRTGIDIHDVDTLIFASTDMDMMEPATANIVQAKLGIKRINAFDVSNACNSFLQAMNLANSLLATGAARRIIVCSGELGSNVTCKELKDVKELRVKMGGLTIADGGAAVLMEPTTCESGEGLGISEINLMSMGEHWKLCHVPQEIDWREQGEAIYPWFYLDMPALAQIARRYSIEYFQGYERIRQDVYGEKNFTESLDFFVPHQISRKMIETISFKAMKMDSEKVTITADIFGNTASTAIPMALRWLIDNERLKIGTGQDCFLYGAASGFGMGHIRIKL